MTSITKDRVAKDARGRQAAVDQGCPSGRKNFFALGLL